MERDQKLVINRKQIVKRLLYTIVNVVILDILMLIIQISVVFQFSYRVIRYVGLNENRIPFPFNDFPVEIEQPEESVSF